MTKRVRKLAIIAILIYMVLAAMGGIFVAEGSLHLRRLPLRFFLN